MKNYKRLLLKSSLIIVMLFSMNNLYSQNWITIEAGIYSEGTEIPIAYSNVELLDGRLKSVADKNGNFVLSFDERIIKASDSFKITAFNHQVQKVKATSFLKFLRNTNKIYLKPIEETEQTQKQTGMVMVEDVALQGAKVKIRNTNLQTYTNSEGSFALPLQQNDELLVSAFGMKPSFYTVSDIGNIQIELEPDGELLREVYLEGKSLEAFKYDLGFNGKKTFDEITYSASLIDESVVKPNYYNIRDLLNNRTSKFLYSRNSSIFVNTNFIIDLDGMLYAGADNNVLDTIDPQNIKSITILNSLTASHKYGTLARAGVIVIRTKLMSKPEKAPEVRTPLVKGNNYQEGRLETARSHNPYLKFGEPTESLKKQIKENLKNNASVSTQNYFEAVDYFLINDRKFAMDLLQDFALINESNPDNLRLLAMKYETLGEFEKAKLSFQKVLELMPFRAQSYLDIAQIYEKTGLYKESFDYYKAMFHNWIEGIDFTPIQDVLSNEIQRFLIKHRQKVDYSQIPMDLRRAKFELKTRIVFEWIDPYKEFELQFVDPGNKYFSWRNNMIDNSEFMQASIKNGLSTEEFVIEESVINSWMINILPEGTQDGNPIFLKYTVFKNYGTDMETEESKLVVINKSGKKYQLAKLQ